MAHWKAHALALKEHVIHMVDSALLRIPSEEMSLPIPRTTLCLSGSSETLSLGKILK